MKHELYTISLRSQDRLIINKKKDSHLYGIVAIAVFLGIWLFFIFNTENQDANRNFTQQLLFLFNRPDYWIFCLVIPLILIFNIIRLLYKIILGEKITIDKTSGHILRNGTIQITIKDISHLQIRKYVGNDGDTDYRLSIVHLNQEKMFIDRSSDEDGILEFAEEIADFLEKEIKFLNSGIRKLNDKT